MGDGDEEGGSEDLQVEHDDAAGWLPSSEIIFSLFYLLSSPLLRAREAGFLLAGFPKWEYKAPLSTGTLESIQSRFFFEFFPF